MPPSTPQTPLDTTLTTTLALVDQFSASLSHPAATTTTTGLPTAAPSPLPLLSASAAALKSQVTKLSLFTITSPFTPSAVATSLTSLNASVLPSLVTAALLITPAEFTSTFTAEATALTKTTLSDLKILATCVQRRSNDGTPKANLGKTDKAAVTEATGRVWDDCNALVKFASEGLAGFLVRRAKQWLELMKDAVKELEEWDPEDEEDGLFGSEDDADDDNDDVVDVVDEAGEASKNAHRATMQAGVKGEALKVLSRIPQSVHVVVKQRLEKLPDMQKFSTDQRQSVDTIVRRARTVSEYIDESAEAMYMGDLELCLKKAGEARALTIEIVEAVVEPWRCGERESDQETKEDKYIRRALDWIRQVEPGGPKGSSFPLRNSANIPSNDT